MTNPTPEELDTLLRNINANWARMRALFERNDGPLDDERAAEAEPILERIEAGMRELKAIAKQQQLCAGHQEEKDAQ